MKSGRRVHLLEIYRLLYNHFGPQHWWPGETALEVIVGAILTQNTSWSNVEKAINNLRNKNLLDAQKLHEIESYKLAEVIRPAGYYNVKAKRLKAFMEFLWLQYEGKPEKLFQEKNESLREVLLNIYGVGEETADSILLYAGQRPYFVVDAYTKRIFTRLEFLEENGNYHQVQKLFMDNLLHEVELFNEFHALIVAQGKYFCRAKPICPPCPLRTICPYDGGGR